MSFLELNLIGFVIITYLEKGQNASHTCKQIVFQSSVNNLSVATIFIAS